MSETSFRKRSLYILSFLLFWAFLASCHVFYYSVWKKEKYLTESRKKGWKEYHIPPLRGALKDKNNAVILQTRVRYDLVVTRVHSSLEARKKRRKTLKRLYPSFLFEMPPEALKKGLKEWAKVHMIQRIYKPYSNREYCMRRTDPGVLLQ